MISLEGCKGFSTLQTTAGLLLAAVFTGSALNYLPGILDDADREITRHAASSEAMHQAVWNAWQHTAARASGNEPLTPLRYGFAAEGDLVQSPLGGYCFAPSDPLNTLDLCQSLTSE